MKKLKELKIVLAILLVVLVLVIAKTMSKNRLNQDAINAIEAVSNSNFSVSLNEFKAAQNQFLVVDLSESGSAQFENSMKVPFDKLLEESTIQKLKETQGKILLVSTNNSQTSKAWVILNQIGIKNVFVLTNEENQEILKYAFQPDSITRLESDFQVN